MIMFTSVELIENLERISKGLDETIKSLVTSNSVVDGMSYAPFTMYLAVFLLACFVGYCVIWNVTSALHAPLMSVTNAISSVIIVGALIGAGQTSSVMTSMFGFLAVILASINIFGGFYITHRMLEMFRSEKSTGGK